MAPLPPLTYIHRPLALSMLSTGAAQTIVRGGGEGWMAPLPPQTATRPATTMLHRDVACAMAGGKWEGE